MKKGEMQVAFKQLLNRRMEILKRAVERENKPSAMMLFGEICGIADSMYMLGVVDCDQRDYIKNEALNIRERKEPEYEPC